MRIWSLILLLGFIMPCLSQTKIIKKYADTIDYRSYFTETQLTANNLKDKSNLQPMLEVGTIIPNGGIYRFFPHEGWKKNGVERYTRVFEESPYQEHSTVRYARYGWWKLERNKDIYNFDEVIEPLLKQAYNEKSRVVIGLASMCAENSKDMSHRYGESVISIPDYLFDELNRTTYRPFKDELYVKSGYSVDYDSPLLYERYKKLLKNFAKWLDKPLQGTKTKRSTLVYGIELRYLGYWGEGSVVSKIYPQTNLIDKYIDLYLTYFPNLLLIGAAQETIHLPVYKGNELSKYNNRELVAMRHVYKLLTSKNEFSRVGLFIDSWMPYSDMYDVYSNRVLLDNDDNIHYLSDFLIDSVWGHVYLSGEFGYIVRSNNKHMKPYAGLYQQFITRHVSGLSVHNLTAWDNGKNMELEDSVYNRVKECLSMIGYRIVLDSVSIKKKGNKGLLSFCLTNIGTSRIFHNYYEMHVTIKDSIGAVKYEEVIPFDLRRLKNMVATPLAYNINYGSRIEKNIPFVKGGNVYMSIKDKFGIEYPMTLSNWGRQADGSYFMGKIQ